jgi:RNA polymerase sigma-70 factor, ECF subfamily
MASSQLTRTGSVMWNRDDPDQILARAAIDQPEAFAVLYRRHVDAVYRYLLVRLGNVHDTQDVTAQTFMAAFDAIGSYRAKGVFTAWLIGIARRKAADHHRRSRPTQALEILAAQPDPAPLPDEIAAHAAQIAQVIARIQALSPDRAEAVALRYFAGLEIPEIAQLMRKREPAVRMLIHRGLADLRAVLNMEEDR